MPGTSVARHDCSPWMISNTAFDRFVAIAYHRGQFDASDPVYHGKEVMVQRNHL